MISEKWLESSLEIQKQLYKVPKSLYDINTYGIHNGYNVIVSGRGGGKSTGVEVLALIAYENFGVTTVTLRASKEECTKFACESYFDNLINIPFDDGRNVIQHITHDRYNRIQYYYREHCFRLMRDDENVDTVKKTREPFMYITSIDKSSDLCSTFNKPTCKLIICEEICDDRVNTKTFMDTMHLISTIYRDDVNTAVIMLGNISRGNPNVLIKLGVYDKIRTSTEPFFIHQTKLGTRIHTTLFNALPEENTKKHEFNKMYFGFDVEGMEILRGVSQPTELYRKLPDDVKTVDTGYYLYILGCAFKVYQTYSDIWQSMYYIKQVPLSALENLSTYEIIVTDDEHYSYTHPRTYYNFGQEFSLVKDFIIHYRRHDICYDKHFTKIAVDSLADLHKVPNVF